MILTELVLRLIHHHFTLIIIANNASVEIYDVECKK
jgi:hypothetical protein